MAGQRPIAQLARCDDPERPSVVRSVRKVPEMTESSNTPALYPSGEISFAVWQMMVFYANGHPAARRGRPGAQAG